MRVAKTVTACHPESMTMGSASRTWTLVGTTALSVSTIGPAWLAEESVGALALMALDFVVAIVVITGIVTTLPEPCQHGARAARRPLQSDPAR